MCDNRLKQDHAFHKCRRRCLAFSKTCALGAPHGACYGTHHTSHSLDNSCTYSDFQAPEDTFHSCHRRRRGGPIFSKSRAPDAPHGAGCSSQRTNRSLGTLGTYGVHPKRDRASHRHHRKCLAFSKSCVLGVPCGNHCGIHCTSHSLDNTRTYGDHLEQEAAFHNHHRRRRASFSKSRALDAPHSAGCNTQCTNRSLGT